MTQLDISFDPPPHNGTPTSEAAAEAIACSAETLRWRVFNLLQERWPSGLTDGEMQTLLGMDGSTQRPRRIELVSRGLVLNSGHKRKTPAGREAVVWVVKGPVA